MSEIKNPRHVSEFMDEIIPESKNNVLKFPDQTQMDIEEERFARLREIEQAISQPKMDNEIELTQGERKVVDDFKREHGIAREEQVPVMLLDLSYLDTINLKA